MVKRIKPSPDEIERRRLQEREEALGRMRDHDVARGRLESWSGGRVKPLIREDE
ncbi:MULTISPECIES: hypothetical protein [unclassified Bradyrhizobium]|uniref:hypothetical protein n=1 Tax=unclassified Bradyrhizobium TaxID=2631580 RepID=UPI002916A662|nr:MULTISPECIES: hypothetical protein [unclassified Bradyrhizobium]